MNISLKKEKDLTGVLTVSIEEKDYAEKVEKKLKEHRKKANIKGFRPGNVPMPLIKKWYGSTVLVEEINHILSHAVGDYIRDEKLPIIGDPMPNEEQAAAIDWDNQKDFTFDYDLGFHGEFEIDFSKIKNIASYEIKVDKKQVDETLETLKKQFGGHSHPEAAEDGDMIFGKFQLGEWEEKSAIPMNAINAKSKKIFLGAKKEDVLTFDILKVFVDKKSAALATGKKEEEVDSLAGEASFTVESLTRNTPAEMNQEFFDKVLGPGKATNEKEFIKEVTEIIETNYKRESEYLLRIDAEKAIVEQTKIDFNDAFLMKWLTKVNEGKHTKEEIEKDFDNVKKDIRWSLIKNEIAVKNDIKVEYPEVVAKAKELVRSQFGSYLNPDDPNTEAMVEKIANGYLTDKSKPDNFMNLYNQALADKIAAVIIEKVSTKITKIDVDKFKKITEELRSE